MRGESRARVVVKVGKSFWEYNACEGKVELDEWVCRSIQGRGGYSFRALGRGSITRHEPPVTYAYLVRKIPGFTWKKLSTKTGDYGWAENIPEYCRRKFRVEDGKITLWRLFSTKLQAAKDELKHCEEMLKGSLEFWDKTVVEDLDNETRSEMEEDIVEERKNVREAKANLTRVRNARKKRRN